MRKICRNCTWYDPDTRECPAYPWNLITQADNTCNMWTPKKEDKDYGKEEQHSLNPIF